MKTFALATLTILVGTFIANINATVPMVVTGTVSQELARELPQRTAKSNYEQQKSELNLQLEELIESIASDVGKFPSEIAALHSRSDSLDKRLSALESRPVSAVIDQYRVDDRLSHTDGMLTRMLARIEQLESRAASVGTYKAVGYSSSASSNSSNGSVGGGSVGGGSIGSYRTQPVYSTCSSPASQHWSYPGDITTHLQSSHGVSSQGMSTEQLKTLHDSLHESQVSANCPGGVCPSNGFQSSTVNSQRRGLIGRRSR